MPRTTNRVSVDARGGSRPECALCDAARGVLPDVREVMAENARLRRENSQLRRYVAAHRGAVR